MFDKTKLKHEPKITEAKLAERDKILANLAHSIKNLISSVQSPLNSVFHSSGLNDFNKLCIEDALKGLNLIKEIAFAIDHSYTGSIEDFRFDAQCKVDTGATVQSLTLKALMHSVINMFDRDYFERFSFNYFSKQDKVIKDRARAEYDQLIANYDRDKISEWLNRYFFDCKINIDLPTTFRLNDTKSSATKFFMMMQEILLNAIKYSSFVPREQRFIEITIQTTGDKIQIIVKNSMDSSIKEKTTGKGAIVITQFAKILGSEPTVCKLENDGIFKFSLEFENFWHNIAMRYPTVELGEKL